MPPSDPECAVDIDAVDTSDATAVLLRAQEGPLLRAQEWPLFHAREGPLIPVPYLMSHRPCCQMYGKCATGPCLCKWLHTPELQLPPALTMHKYIHVCSNSVAFIGASAR